MKQRMVVAAIVLWFVCVLGAFGFVWRYKTAPGPRTVAPERWPHDSSLVLSATKPTLLVFAHPQCPCTRASIAELARLATRLGERAQIQIVLVRPPGTDPGFEDGTIAERAKAIPGARVIVDDGAKEADRFGAQTSGATLLYTSNGALAFSGGLTSARGHEGESPGQERILAVVKGEANPHVETAPTFGCELGQVQTMSTIQ